MVGKRETRQLRRDAPFDLESVWFDMATRLNSLAIDIEQITSDSSAQFLDIGYKLQNLYNQAGTMSNLTQECSNGVLSTDTEQNLLLGVGETATASLTNLRQSQQDSQSLFERITETLNVIRLLLKSAESITDIGGQLEIIGINLAIQTSRHRYGAETFEDFSSEIKGLSVYTRRLAEEIQQDAAEVGDTLAGVKNQLEKKLLHMDRFIVRAEQETGQTLKAVEALAAKSMKTMSQKAVHAQNISRAVNEAIVAIQLDDITRQRMDHVLNAIRDISRDRVSLDNASMLIALQANQLKEIQANIHSARRDIINVFSAIGDEIRKMDAIASGDGKQGDTTTYTSLKHLQETLFGLDKIHEEAMDVRRTITVSLDKAIRSSERISRHIGAVSTMTQELNLKAINALLMSRDLGTDGNNLVVLAKELHALSKDSISIIFELKNTIEHVEQVTTNLKQETLEQKIDDKTGKLFSEKLGEVGRALTAQKSTSAESHKLGVEIAAEIEKISAELSSFILLTGRLSECEASLQEILRLIKPYVNEDEMDSTVMEQVYRQYTMEQERKVHRSMSERNGTTPMVEVASPENMYSENVDRQPEYEDNDLGDFELF